MTVCWRMRLWCLCVKMGKKERVAGVILATLLCLTETCLADCRRGDSGAEVYRVQVELLKQGFPVTLLDGRYGVETESNVIVFQEKYGLPADGVVDRETYYSLLSREHLCTDVNPRVLRLFDIATLMLSTKYSWGGENSQGFDCSGFTEYCYGCIGISLPRTADVQYGYGRAIGRRELCPGDMVFFSTYEPGASHCGIYIGSNKFIHAGSSTGVAIADLDNVYWKQHYYGACRVLRQ